jgi:N-methylhydantoinase A
MKARASLRAGIDVGGTFTDIVTAEEGRPSLRIRKTPSTRNQAEGILTGLSDIEADLGRFVDISHGTTVATNILLEGKGARTAVITTRGFRDTLEIGRCRRLVPGSIFNTRFVRPPPLVPREHRYEIDERIAADGSVIVPLDVGGLHRLAELLHAARIEAVAICFINAHANDSHEREAKAVVARLLPDVVVCCSSEIVPQIREYERFSTVAVNCAVAPVMSRYMTTLVAKLRERGYRNDVLTMASTAGLLSAETVVAEPVRTVLSGPAAAVNGAIHIGKLASRTQLITYDMGGTSTDVCLIDKGEPLVAADSVLNGMPISIPQLDIHTVGTGGGSIAWIDVDGAPRVGPRSAGADPGPIAYGKGGSEITVTDANLLLGRLPALILGGQMTFDPEAVRAAFDRFRTEIAYPGPREDLAEGLIRLAVTTMSGTVRKISIERGYDPRDFSLFAIGGAGPMHAAAIAEELEMREVIVPPLPGNISAYGHLVGDLKYDAMKNFRAPLPQFAARGGPAVLEALAEQTRARLIADGVAPRSIATRYFADLRYVGQSYEISVPIARPFAVTRIKRDFLEIYRRRYGHQHEEAIEFTSLKTLCSAPKRTKLAFDAEVDDGAPQSGTRQVYFGGRWYRAQVLGRGGVRGSRPVHGPAIIEEYGATTVVPPGWSAKRGAGGCVLLTRTQARTRTRGTR